MDELIQRLNESIAAAREAQKEHQNSFLNGMIAGFNSALECANDIRKEGMYDEY